MKQSRFCGELARNPVQLAADWLGGGGTTGLLSSLGSQTVFTQSGRAAILLAARIWGLGPDDAILVPAYNCGSDISPLIATGANVSMYRVDDRARPDLEDLMRLITPQVKLVLVTHYFGRSTDIKELVRFCRQRNIKVLEDCALSLFSEAIANSGDGAIFSFRKSLPVPDGGALVLRERIDLPDDEVLAPRKSDNVLDACSLVKKWARTTLAYSSRAGTVDSEGASRGGQLPDIPPSYYCHGDSAVRGASRFTRGFLRRVDVHEVTARRRENYTQLRRRLLEIEGFKLLWDDETLAQGVCPLGLPILVDDRQRWRARLNAAGISVTPWWEGYHRGLNWDRFPEARRLKRDLILLPIHQELTVEHIAHIARVVRSVGGAKS